MTNREIRRQVWDVLRRHPLRLLGLTAMTVIPFLAAALWVAMVYGVMLWNDLFILYTDAGGMVRMGVNHGLTYGQLNPYITGMFAGVCFVGILSRGLAAGHHHCLLTFMRGEVPTVSTLFGRMDACLKMLGLEVLVALKALVRLMPLLLIGVLIAQFDPSASSGLSQLVLAFAPLAVMIWLARLIFSHALSGYAIADTPEIRIREAIARSKAVMEGRMWRYFGLLVPYLLVAWAVTAAAAALMSAVPAAETAVSLLALGLYALLALLAKMAGAAFYAQKCKPVEAAGEAVEEAAGEASDEPETSTPAESNE